MVYCLKIEKTEFFRIFEKKTNFKFFQEFLKFEKNEIQENGSIQ